MRHRKRLDRERPERERLSRFGKRQEARRRVELVLRQPASHQPERVGRSVHRDVDPREQERKRADVIFVAVGQDDGVDRPAVVEELHVGDDDVDAQVLGAREHHPRVDDQTVPAVAVDHQVHPELA